MKLNLLPAEASRGNLRPLLIAMGAVIALGAIAASVLMISHARGQLAKAQERALALEAPYQKTVAISNEADTVIESATDIDRNLKLANAMLEHNPKHVRLADEVLSYVPNFFRVTNYTAAAVNETTSVVTLTGVLRSKSEYSMMPMALLRIPDAINVTRSGYVSVDKIVPALTEIDQVGTRLLPGEETHPGDPWEHFQAHLQEAQDERRTGFQNVGGFGSGTDDPRGAMPDWSLTTFTITIARNMQAPDARATLVAGGQAPAAAAPGGAAPAPGGRGVAPGPGAPPVGGPGTPIGGPGTPQGASGQIADNPGDL